LPDANETPKHGSTMRTPSRERQIIDGRTLARNSLRECVWTTATVPRQAPSTSLDLGDTHKEIGFVKATSNSASLLRGWWANRIFANFPNPQAAFPGPSSYVFSICCQWSAFAPGGCRENVTRGLEPTTQLLRFLRRRDQHAPHLLVLVAK